MFRGPPLCHLPRPAGVVVGPVRAISTGHDAVKSDRCGFSFAGPWLCCDACVSSAPLSSVLSFGLVSVAIARVPPICEVHCGVLVCGSRRTLLRSVASP